MQLSCRWEEGVSYLTQWFSTFFDSRHLSFFTEQFGGTRSYNLPVNGRQVHKLAAPQELFSAPRLRTTDLTGHFFLLKCLLNIRSQI